MSRDQHFILTLGRSGSNTLVDTLNQNPALLNFGEVLGDWMPIRKIQRRAQLYKGRDADYVDALLGNAAIQMSANLFRNAGKLRRGTFQEIKRLGHVRSIGVKEFSLNLNRYGLKTYLKKRGHIKVIGLHRENPIARMISSKRLGRTGIVGVRTDGSQTETAGNSSDNTGFYLSPEDALAAIEIVDAENQMLRGMLDALPEDRVFKIDYDDFYASPERCIDIASQAQEFLGVDVHPIKIRMKKIFQGDPLDQLVNAQEVRDAIHKSRFQSYLV